MEEYGVTSNQATVYATWGQNMVSSGLTGELFWQAGSHLPDGDTSNDGYAIYPGTSTIFWGENHPAQADANSIIKQIPLRTRLS